MEPVVLRLVVVLAIIGVSLLAGVVWQARDGRVRDTVGGFTPAHLAAVGLPRSPRGPVGLLLGSPTCAPCVTVRGLLARVEAERPGFRWVYVDAGDHLAVADAHHGMRVPTLFLVGPGGAILARTSGVPDLDDLREVLDRHDGARVGA